MGFSFPESAEDSSAATPEGRCGPYIGKDPKLFKHVESRRYNFWDIS
jgi:hypothetical protein